MSNKANDKILDQYADALAELEKSNLRLLETLSRAIDVIVETNSTHRRILETSTQMRKTINDFRYYERHGSPTLPKNQKIDVTTDFNKLIINQ